MATSFNAMYNKLFIEASLKNKVVQILSDYCRKGITEIKPCYYFEAYANENNINIQDLEEEVYELAKETVKKQSKSTESTEKEIETPEEKPVEEAKETAVDPATPSAILATLDKDQTEKIIRDQIQKYIDTKESNISLYSYIQMFMNSHNQEGKEVLDYNNVRCAIYNLAMESCKKSLNEAKEDGLKISDNDIVQAFKDYTGKRIPNPERKEHKIEDFDQEQLYKGIMAELEHTDDINYALEIVVDHLVENPKYYNFLEKMEADMEKNPEGPEKNGELEKNDEGIKEAAKISDDVVIPTHIIKKTEIFELLKKKTSRIPTLSDSALKALAIEIYNIMADNSLNVDDNGKMNRISVLLTKKNYVNETEVTNLFSYIKKIMFG